MLQEEMGEFHVSADIGCHLFSILPPFNIGNTTMGYGLGAAGASAFNTESDRPAISIMGDGGFWHNGLTSGIGNAVFNKSDGLTIVVDNNYSAATGGQDLLSSKGEAEGRSTQHPIEKAVQGIGVKWTKTVRTYDIGEMRKALKEAVTQKGTGPKVLVAQSECMLNKQRREKPLFAKAVGDGKRVVRERFGVDEDTCTGDHACIRLSGCPSLTVKPNPDPLKRQPVSFVDNSCVGCGNCGEVAHEAVLCPSFYKAEIIFNPGAFDVFLWDLRKKFIGWLQKRADRRRLRAA
jgi:indolepyruvate ferredoxin oxidoreductase alpha subunit